MFRSEDNCACCGVEKCQPLLEAKDAEIAECKAAVTRNIIKVSALTEENTTIKAKLESMTTTGSKTSCGSCCTLLEQAREGLVDCNRELWYCAMQAGFDWKNANPESLVFKVHAKAKQTLAAINAATNNNQGEQK